MATVTHNPRADVNLQAHFFNSSREIESDNHSGKGAQAGTPCTDSYPDLNLLIKRHEVRARVVIQSDSLSAAIQSRYQSIFDGSVTVNTPSFMAASQPLPLSKRPSLNASLCMTCEPRSCEI